MSSTTTRRQTPRRSCFVSSRCVLFQRSSCALLDSHLTHHIQRHCLRCFSGELSEVLQTKKTDNSPRQSAVLFHSRESTLEVHHVPIGNDEVMKEFNRVQMSYIRNNLPLLALPPDRFLGKHVMDTIAREAQGWLASRECHFPTATHHHHNKQQQTFTRIRCRS